MLNFIKYWPLYLVISSAVIITGLFSIFKYGFVYSIDFKGGSVVEYRFEKPIDKQKISEFLQKDQYEVSSLSKTSANSVLVRTSPMDQTQEAELRENLEGEFSKVDRLRFETVGPSLGEETVNKTIIAAIVAVVGILLYMAFAFSRISFGLSAVLAMMHDILILVGAYSLLGRFAGAQVDTLFVTAALTTMSFSVHDTIVVFDKIREHSQTDSDSFATLANKALTETMVRSINNSLTIILMLVPLVLMGGETIKYFAAALLIGTIAGTYSSPFVATPLAVFFHSRKKN